MAKARATIASFATTLALVANLAAGHGIMTKPVARQLLLGGGGYGVGLTNPGAGQCDISSGNGMNMNGCQGAGGVVDFQSGCWTACGGQLASQDTACKECKEQKANAYKATLNPAPKLGACGDLYWRNAFSTNFSTDVCDSFAGTGSCIEKALQQPFSEVTLATDNSFEVELKITAHHWGWSEFRLCREGGVGRNREGVTQECFNQDVLRFDAAESAARYPADKMAPGLASAPANPSDYIGTHPAVRCDGPGEQITNSAKLEFPEIWAPEGSCCNQGGDCGDSNVSSSQNVRWVFPNGAAMGSAYKLRLLLPPGLECTQGAPCTLQWTFMTGNSRSSYPEAFRNCADFKIAGERSSGTPSQTTAAPTTAATTAGPTDAATTGAPTDPTAAPTVAATTATPATGGSTVCVHNPSNTQDVTDDAVCAPCQNGQTWWPCSPDLCICSETSGGGEPTPEPEPEPESTAAPTAAATTAAPTTAAPTTASTTAAPTTTPGSVTALCVANPSNDQSATDGQCEPCAGGYEWWPCNFAGLCDCSGSTATATTAATATVAATTPAAATTAAPVTTAAPATGGGSSGSNSPCDDGSANSCKSKCSAACGHAVATNQCWGNPRYVECKCSHDDSTHTFDGCACLNGNCGLSRALVEEAFTKHKKKVRKHSFLAGDHLMIQRRGLKMQKTAAAADETSDEPWNDDAIVSDEL